MADKMDEKFGELHEEDMVSDAADEMMDEELSEEELEGVAGGAGIQWKPLAGAQAKKKKDFMDKGILTC